MLRVPSVQDAAKHFIKALDGKDRGTVQLISVIIGAAAAKAIGI